jgi:hypothetical protein
MALKADIDVPVKTAGLSDAHRLLLLGMLTALGVSLLIGAFSKGDSFMETRDGRYALILFADIGVASLLGGLLAFLSLMNKPINWLAGLSWGMLFVMLFLALLACGEWVVFPLVIGR